MKRLSMFLAGLSLLIGLGCNIWVPNAALVSNPPSYQTGDVTVNESTVINYKVDDFGNITEMTSTVTGEGGVSGTLPSRACVLSHALSTDCREVSGITLYTTVNAGGTIDLHFEKDGKEFTP